MKKKEKTIKTFGRFVLAFVVALIWSTAWADFYVVPVGKKAKQTVLVSPQSTQAESGTALLNALAGITDASETKPYLIIVEPGVYDIGSNSLTMKPYVDIEGSGESVTKITGNIDGYYEGVVEGADHAELRFLTVEHSGGITNARAIYNDGTSPKLTSVTVIATGGTSSTWGIWNDDGASPVMTNVKVTASGTGPRGIVNDQSAAVMTNVTVIATATSGTSSTGISSEWDGPAGSQITMTNVIVTASGGATDNYAISNNLCSPVMTNVTATASGGVTYNAGVRNTNSEAVLSNVSATAWDATGSRYGMWNSGSIGGTYTVKAYNSRFSGETATIRNSANKDSVVMNTFVGASQLDGGDVMETVNGTGVSNITCAVSYDEDYNELDADCAPTP